MAKQKQNDSDDELPPEVQAEVDRIKAEGD